MTALPNKGELTKIAKELGYSIECTGGRHATKLVHESGHKIPVPTHGSKDIAKGTMKSILKQMGYCEVAKSVAVHLDLNPNKILITSSHIAQAKKQGLDIANPNAQKGQRRKRNKDWRKVRAIFKMWKKHVKNALKANADYQSGDKFKANNWHAKKHHTAHFGM